MPASLRRVVQSIRQGAEMRIALGEFLDEFYRRPDQRQVMIDEDPGFLGVARDDAYIGAVGEHLARRWTLTIPAWTEQPERFLLKPYWVGNVEVLKPYFLMESPLAFRRRMIFTELEPLRRGRFPRAEMIETPYA